MNANTPCGETREQLALLLYGELSFDQEERVETHLETCAECRGALERERAMLAAFDQAAVEPSPSLLMECRESLAARLETEPAPAAAPSWIDRILDTLAPRFPAAWMKPAGAVALLAMGFLGARIAPNLGSGVFAGMGVVSDPGASRIRYIEPAADGRIQIVLDETRQRVVLGRMEDANIRGLLLTATREPSDAGLRARTVELLTGRAQADDIRDALVYAVSNDQNDGVRLTALKGLESFARDPEVRGALAVVLQRDPNAEIRMAAMEMLIGGLADTGGGPGMDREMIQVFQELMSREDNVYLRQQAQRALELVRASAEIY